MLTTENYNPDVLSCLANLSSDEVFTPPGIVNQMLDLLPDDLWRHKNARFLDPASKSGVFLREIARRLDTGLESEIPDRQARIDHIFKHQVYGLPITELTALLTRRSLYCSKAASGKYSVCTAFDDEEGNVRFERVEHTWREGRCEFCGASEAAYQRGEELETHAYRFIHTESPEEVFGMQFDVIISNPPYQLADGGFGRSASPLYNQFVRQARKINPRYLSMIIPSRWFAGGKGLDEFREDMLSDRHLRKIVDYEDSTIVFPGVSVAGGICYFLWDRDNPGPCEVVNAGEEPSYSATRELNEHKIFVRHTLAVPIIDKVLSTNEPRMSAQVSAYKPFGLRTYVQPQPEGDILLFWQGGVGPFKRADVTAGLDMIDQWKVVASRSGHEHAGGPGIGGSRRVLARVEVLPPGTVCTETYLVIGVYSGELQAANLVTYMRTKFFRFLMSVCMFSHGINRDTFAFIPVLDMDREWTDTELYAKYSLTAADVAFIESRIRPMEPSGQPPDADTYGLDADEDESE